MITNSRILLIIPYSIKSSYWKEELYAYLLCLHIRIISLDSKRAYRLFDFRRFILKRRRRYWNQLLCKCFFSVNAYSHTLLSITITPIISRDFADFLFCAPFIMWHSRFYFKQANVQLSSFMGTFFWACLMFIPLRISLRKSFYFHC